MNPIAAQELSELGELIAHLKRGEWNRTEFRANSVHYGVYTQKQPDRFFVRLRIPHGVISREQLGVLADAIEKHGPGVCHLTTRQGVEVHDLALDKTLPLLHTLAEHGLYSHETGGSAIRGVLVCPHGGATDSEPFDVTPFAALVTAQFFRNPEFQALPRKMKIGFSCCDDDCAHTSFQDLGFQARVDAGGRPGFRVLVGGGTGAIPRIAQELFAFIPTEELLIMAEGFLRMFNRLGDRENRARARVKFLVQKLGITEFRVQVQSEIETLRAAGKTYPSVEAATVLSGRAHAIGQNLRIPLGKGEITSRHLRGVAELANRFQLEVRTTPEQGLLLRQVRPSCECEIRERLATLGLDRSATAARLVICPGSSGCSNAFTHAPALAEALTATFTSIPADALCEMSIGISGCLNGCTMHACADCGLEGVAIRSGSNWIPAYRIWIGGRDSETMPQIGTDIGIVPARRVPECIGDLLTCYASTRNPGESFADFVGRVGAQSFRPIVQRFRVVNGAPGDPSLAIDWSESAPYQPRHAKSGGAC